MFTSTFTFAALASFAARYLSFASRVENPKYHSWFARYCAAKQSQRASEMYKPTIEVTDLIDFRGVGLALIGKRIIPLEAGYKVYLFNFAGHFYQVVSPNARLAFAVMNRIARIPAYEVDQLIDDCHCGTVQGKVKRIYAIYAQSFDLYQRITSRETAIS